MFRYFHHNDVLLCALTEMAKAQRNNMILKVLSIYNTFKPAFLVRFFLIFIIYHYLLQILISRTAAVINLILSCLGTDGIGCSIEEFEVSAIQRDDSLSSLSCLHLHSLESLQALQWSFGIGRILRLLLHHLGSIFLANITYRHLQRNLLTLLQDRVGKCSIAYTERSVA